MILRGNFNSEVLHMSTHIQVMFPDKGEAPLRIVYLLHGLHGDSSTWLDYTPLPYYAKKFNAIFVMPEVCRSFYTDQRYGRKYFTYVSEELPHICRRFFNFSARREDTAVMGCSMGGFGSLYLALNKPEQYGFCGPISPACLCVKGWLDQMKIDPAPLLKNGPEAYEMVIDIKSLYGEELEYDKKYDIYELVKSFPADAPRPVIFNTCGLEDDLRKESLKLKDIIADRGFNYTYEEWTGGHEWNFFYEALQKTLEFWYKGYEA